MARRLSNCAASPLSASIWATRERKPASSLRRIACRAASAAACSAARTLRLARGDPVRSDACRRMAASLEKFGDRLVRMRRDRRRHAGQGRLQHQVVGERVLAQDLRLLELAPRVGERQGAGREHLLGKLDREVDAGDRGDARKRDRRRGELPEAALDQVANARRSRQASSSEVAPVAIRCLSVSSA